MNYYIGYLLIVVYILLLLIINQFVKIRHRDNLQSIATYLFAGENIPTWLLTTSVFSAWIWVTTIIGSAEACVLYGLSGAIGYTLGASLAFFIFIFIILHMQKLMPESTSFLEFMGERYTGTVKNIYYVFAILTTVYVAIEQAAGLSFVLNAFFDTSYKKIAFISFLIAVIFVVITGMRGVLYNEFINFFIIIVGFAVFTTILVQSTDFQQIRLGLTDVINNPENVNYNPDFLNVASVAGIRYSIMAIIIAFGQILFDPAYYVKASLAKNSKAARRAFLIGGILFWCPIGIASAFSLGFISVAMNINFTKSLNISADIPTKLASLTLGNPMILCFSFIIVCIGITTIIHYLIGIQTIFTIDFYKNSINKDAVERDKIKFGRTITILVSVFCGLIAIALENISLLTIDMFSGVFFAAPCGALFAGILFKKDFGNLPVYSIAAGLILGFYVWIFGVENNEWAWFWGTMTAFLLPVIFMYLSSKLIKKPYNFARLRFWKP